LNWQIENYTPHNKSKVQLRLALVYFPADELSLHGRRLPKQQQPLS